jgi:outer membrane receptor protein involved in Fe transport
MTFRGESLAAVALCVCLALLRPAFAEPTYAQGTKYDLDISGADLTVALPALSRQTGVVVLYPYELAQVRSNPVKGSYTVSEALQVMLQGTGFSGDVSAQGAVSISPRKKGCDTEGETMNRDLKSSVSILALFAGLFSWPACAQTDTTAAAATPETVVVTGSRVITEITNSPTPITAVSQEQLLATTPSDASDALNKLPVFVGSATQRNAGSASGNAGGDFLNLRNFGQQRTLVLMDGMRVPASNNNGSVDISTLPQVLFQRVDVVTGGGSAVYGSDAITGVVNFILDKSFTGVKYEANAGISQYADGFSWKANVAAGTDLFGGRGHLEGSIGYLDRDGVLKESRPSGAENLGSYNTGGSAASPNTNILNAGQTVSTSGGKITCTTTPTAAQAALGMKPCSVNGQEFVQPGVPGPIFYGVIPTTPGDPKPNTAVATGCTDCAHVNNTSIFGATRNASAFGRFSYNLNPDTQAFVQFSLAQANIFNYFFPEQQEPSRQTQYYYKNNAFLPAATRALLGDDSATDPNWATDGTNVFQVSEWYNAPGRVRATNNVTRNIVLTTGVNGEAFGNYDWEAHYTHGEARLSTTGIHNGNNQFHDAAQDAVVDPTTGSIVCWADTAAAIAQFGNQYPGCVPINTFGNNVTTNAQNDYWGRSTHFSETNTMDDLAADISGNVFDLPAGPIKVAVAGEMRWLDYLINSNASPTAVVNCTGLRLCGNTGQGTGFVTQSTVTQTLWDNNTVASVHANESVWEFSGEVGIPVIKDVPLVQSFNVDLAGRYTDYSTSGAVQTWKVGLDWHVIDDVRFRATNSVDIRAPTLNDLYSPQTSNSGPFLDPLTNFNPGGIQTVSQGNPNLVPESSRTYTGGVVLTPTFIPGLSMSIDYYNIKLSNAIASVSGTNLAVANLCIASGGTSPFCTLYVRPFPYTNTTPANYPTLLYSESLNAAFNQTEGEDYEADYTFDMGDIDNGLNGIVTLRALLNVAPVLNSSTFPGAPLQHGFGAGTTTPSQKGHATLFADYTLGNWSVDVQWHWFSDEFKNGVFGAGQTFYAQNRVPSFATTDFTLTKKLALDNGTAMSLYFNVQNAFNDIPPDVLGSNGNPGGINTPTGEDLMGRYFTIGVRGNL